MSDDGIEADLEGNFFHPVGHYASGMGSIVAAELLMKY